MRKFQIGDVVVVDVKRTCDEDGCVPEMYELTGHRAIIKGEEFGMFLVDFGEAYHNYYELHDGLGTLTTNSGRWLYPDDMTRVEPKFFVGEIALYVSGDREELFDKPCIVLEVLPMGRYTVSFGSGVDYLHRGGGEFGLPTRSGWIVQEQDLQKINYEK